MQQEELKRFLDSGFTLRESTDVIVSAKGTEFHVHKSVIGAHSRVLARACSQELKPGAVLQLNLLDADPASIKALLAFCYQPEEFKPREYLRSSINETFGRSLEDEEANIAYTVMCFLAKKLKMARLVRHSLDEIFSEFWSYFGDPPDDPVGRESWAGNQGPRDRVKSTFFVARTDMLYDEKDSFPKALFNILYAYASKDPRHLIRDADYKWLLGEIEGLRDSIVEFGTNNKDQLRTCEECKEGSSISFQDQDYTLYLRDECWRCPKCRAVNKLEEPSREEDTSGRKKSLGAPVEEPPHQAKRRQRASSTASFCPSEMEDVLAGEGLQFRLKNHRGASSAVSAHPN